MRKNIRRSVIGEYFVKALGSCSFEESDGDSGKILILGLSRLSCARSNDDVGPVASYFTCLLPVQGSKPQTANDLSTPCINKVDGPTARCPTIFFDNGDFQSTDCPSQRSSGILLSASSC